jgi:zinc D-Ala-D-Ala carboxypeptidase
MYFKYSDLDSQHLDFLDLIANCKGFVKQNIASVDDLVEHESFLVNSMALSSFQKMRQLASKQGIKLYIVSAFRSLDKQVWCFFRPACPRGSVYNPIGNFFGVDDPKAVEQDYLARSMWVAPPGYSEHHTGLALDLCNQSLEFANTQEYQWLTINAANFGFVQSYPESNVNKKGCSFEPWHWLYIGV